jgi:type I restriction enzyme S subunit
MKIARLGDICDFLDSRRVPVEESLRIPGHYPYYGANGQQGWINGYIFDEPLVLLAEDGGHFGSKTQPIAYQISGKTWVNNHAHVLRPRKICNPDYLCYILSYYDVTSLVSGTTRPKLTKANAEEIKIPLPPLDEQRRIAAILQRADRLRRLRRLSRQLSDTFLQSVFLQMFGDPATNPMGWDTFLLVEICQSPNGIKAGPFGSSLKKEIYTTSGYRVYGQEQVIGGNFGIGNYYISEELFEKQFRQYEVHANDVLISLVGTFGKTIVVPNYTAPGIINPRLLKISPCPEIINSVYLSKYLQLSSVQDQLADLSHGGTMGVLNATQLKELKIMCPPIEHQNNYSLVVASWERIIRRQVESSRQSEQLFQTLLARAFSEI